MSRSKFIWMRVSKDKYELPEIIADSSTELAALCGIKRATIHTEICDYNHGRKTYCVYARVPIEEEDDDV